MHSAITQALASAAGWLKASLLTVAVFGYGLVSAQHQKGPDPTKTSLEASTGPFAIQSTIILRNSVTGFGGGSVHYPVEPGTYGAIALAPGLGGTQLTLAWIGKLLASHGFVVVTIETLSTADFPDSRGKQLAAALDTVVSLSRVPASPIYGKVDASRLGVAGQSVGGGGALTAAYDNPSYKAVIGLGPWHNLKYWADLRVPTLIVAGELDAIANPAQHGMAFLQSMPESTKKTYVELKAANHSLTDTPNRLVGRYMVAWFKRFIDDDTRYNAFLCGPGQKADTGAATPFSAHWQNCALW